MKLINIQLTLEALKQRCKLLSLHGFTYIESEEGFSLSAFFGSKHQIWLTPFYAKCYEEDGTYEIVKHVQVVEDALKALLTILNSGLFNYLLVHSDGFVVGEINNGITFQVGDRKVQLGSTFDDPTKFTEDQLAVLCDDTEFTSISELSAYLEAE